MRCEATDPNGVLSYAEERAVLTPYVWFTYPRDFDGAPDVTNGAYELRWLERDAVHPEKWHELLRVTETVDLP